ncbi:hypothetical protein GCM10022205_31740 [Spinactinospora alkalitolerans]
MRSRIARLASASVISRGCAAGAASADAAVRGAGAGTGAMGTGAGAMGAGATGTADGGGPGRAAGRLASPRRDMARRNRPGSAGRARSAGVICLWG